MRIIIFHFFTLVFRHCTAFSNVLWKFVNDDGGICRDVLLAQLLTSESFEASAD